MGEERRNRRQQQGTEQVASRRASPCGTSHRRSYVVVRGNATARHRRPLVARNLVADQQNTIAESQPTVSESTVFESTAGESSVDDEATSVISQDELAAYFARLAQEEVQTETQEDGQGRTSDEEA